MLRRLISLYIIFTFLLTAVPCHAQDIVLPAPGTMLSLSPAYVPVLIKGLQADPKRPLSFDFIVDRGEDKSSNNAFQNECNKLIQFFLAGLTIPDGDLWVNLSPYEKNRIIPDALGQTTLGKEMLAQDYLLKQLSASLIYPENGLGKEFWDRVRALALKQFGSTDIPVNAFDHKVWILPDQAKIYEKGNAAYVTQATLKVMMEEDYLAMSKQKGQAAALNAQEDKMKALSSQVMREIILPQIEHEINYGKNFASLRQIYTVLILAKWYKETAQNKVLQALYTNQKKIAGINVDSNVKAEIYQRYVEAYKKGTFNYIKEEQVNGQMLPRKYFSGGEVWDIHLDRTGDHAQLARESLVKVHVDLQKSNAAMLAPGAMKAQGLPLIGLDDPQVLKVFRQVVRRRYDVRVLAEYYHLGKVPEKVSFTNLRGIKEMVTLQEYADLMVNYMYRHMNSDPGDFARMFRATFPNNACPPELKSIFSKYMAIKTKSFDLQVVKDALPPNSVVADVGAGKGQLVEEMLKYSDEQGLGIKMVLGTDVTDWRHHAKEDSRLLFVHQKTGLAVPLRANSVDAVVLKWVTHHIDRDKRDAFFKSIWRILKPGGRLIIVDALLTRVTEEQQQEAEIWTSWVNETKNRETWPQGSFYKDNIKLSRDFMLLNGEQQKLVLALEDYFGHNLIMGRDETMPQYFTYMPLAEIREQMGQLGLEEKKEYFRNFGSPPIERMGPPSMRVVFEKSTPRLEFILGGGGETEDLMLGLPKKERKRFETVMDVLVPRSHSIPELKEQHVDDLVLLANDRLETIEETLTLLDAGIGKRIVLLGQMKAVNIMDEAIKDGYKIMTPKGMIEDKDTWIKMKRTFKGKNEETIEKEYTGTGPEIVKQIMLQMVRNFPAFYKELSVIIAQLEDYIIVGDSQNLEDYRKMLEQKHEGKHKMVLISEPWIQLQNIADLKDKLDDLIKAQKVEILSHTISPPFREAGDDNSYKRFAVESLVRSALRMLAISEFGFVDKRINIDQIPPKFWKDLTGLLNSIGKYRAQKLAHKLLGHFDMIRRDKIRKEIDKPSIKELDRFLNKMQALADSNQAMNATQEKGGIDFNRITLNASKTERPTIVLAQQFSALKQGGFYGFTALITHVSPLDASDLP
jgi:SAM-dependent methyltransferase